MAKKDKKLHRENSIVEDESSSKMRSVKYKRKLQQDASEVLEQNVITESKRSKKDRSKSDYNAVTDTALDNLLSQQSLTTKKGKKKHNSESHQNETKVSTSEDLSEQTPSTKKSKKKHRNESHEYNNEDSTIENVPEQTPSKKSKKHKKAKTAESLGVVDTSILQQAEINLGLPIADPVSSQKKNDNEEQSPKKKKKKDKKLQVVVTTEVSEKTRNERAVQYLRLWHSNRKAWKFNKMMQVQLLHNIFDKSLVNEEDFETVLLYLDGLKGKGREKTKEDAKQILDKEETEGTADADKEDRAKQVYQILA